jgi:hypothetical protein
MHGLFQKTFDRRFEACPAGRRAFLLAEAREQTRGFEDAQPTEFVIGSGVGSVAWIRDETSKDFLGNEFLLWLWFTLDEDGDEVALADGTESTVMLARTLVLECPLGQTGRETIRSEGPARLPEARQAVRTGKLPRKAGLTVVRQGQQYELTLDAETLTVAGAKLPPSEADDDQAMRVERLGQVRHLVTTLDLLYDAFGQRRLGAGWRKEAARMRDWLVEKRRSQAGRATG